MHDCLNTNMQYAVEFSKPTMNLNTYEDYEELGHYFAARHHNVPVTLPYFLPMPLSLFGTLGAFIRLQGPVTNRRALFDVGAAGPLAGLVFALPVLFIGLATSAVGPVMPGGIFEGNSILYSLAKLAVFGRLLPGNGVDVHLNQVAWAGWVGLFVTGLNLIPVGQLDGGHVADALFGKRARLFFWPAIVALGLIVLYSWLAGFFTPTWLLWIFLLLAFGRVHARPLEDITELDTRRRVLAVFTGRKRLELAHLLWCGGELILIAGKPA